MSQPSPESKSLSLAYWTMNVTKPTGPVARAKLYELIDFDERQTENSRFVYRFIVGWYHDEHGDALASVRHIVRAIRSRSPKGSRDLSRSATQRAVVLLVETGWIVRTFAGRGRSSSRYVPVFDVLATAAGGLFPAIASHQLRDTNSDSIVSHSIGTLENLASHQLRDTNEISVPPAGTKTCLQDRATIVDPVTDRQIEPAAPTAPDAAGAGAPRSPGSAGEEEREAKGGFDELWRAYGYRRGRAEARKAYEVLAPDGELHATMVVAAMEWRDTWAAQDKADAPRFSLAKWIEREEYECSPPTAYQPKQIKTDKPVAGAKPKRGALTEVLRVLEVVKIGSPFADLKLRLVLDGLSGRQEHVLHLLDVSGPAADGDVFQCLQDALGTDSAQWAGARVRLEIADGRVVGAVREKLPDRVVEIVNSDVIKAGPESRAWFDLADQSGAPEGRLEIIFESQDAETQVEGQKRLASLCRTVGVGQIESTDELEWRPFLLKADGSFEPLPMQEAA
ncbi:MAG: hypothetical protein K0S56_1540 [Microvirga sp.]|jgi:hypothetical protein|nr:hypothetical protein [Microvirga sp.]